MNTNHGAVSALTPEQHAQLLKAIAPSRVSSRDGQSYLEAWDVKAHLTRIFGFGGFSSELIDLVMVYEQETTTKAGKAAYKVGYRATIRLTIHQLGAVYTEAAFGEAIMPDFKRGDAHDMAIKTAESQAVKRAAINLGTQFGLSLYQNGALADVVKATLVGPAKVEAEHVDAAVASVGQVAAEDVPADDPAALAPVTVLGTLSIDEVARINELRHALGFDEETFLAGVRKSLKDDTILDIALLTPEQATSLIARLTKAVESKNAA